jgi:hypothetical protein
VIPADLLIAKGLQFPDAPKEKEASGKLKSAQSSGESDDRKSLDASVGVRRVYEPDGGIAHALVETLYDLLTDSGVQNQRSAMSPVADLCSEATAVQTPVLAPAKNAVKSAIVASGSPAVPEPDATCIPDANE